MSDLCVCSGGGGGSGERGLEEVPHKPKDVLEILYLSLKIMLI